MESKTRFMFFTGKGGVGKTTLASATAYKLAREGKKVLLVSIDPAHSLEDIFETELGPEPKQVSENLFAMQIEPKQVLGNSFKELFEGLRSSLSEFLGASPAGFEQFLEQTLGELTESPGSDEVAAFQVFKDLVLQGSKDYDVVIFDTAPTGHALKFLKLPEILEKQLQANIEAKKKTSGLLSTLKKLLPFYNMTQEEEEELKRLQEEEIAKLKESLADLQKVRDVLTNKDLTKIFVVSNPEGLSFYETKKLINNLNSLGFDIYAIIINKVLPSSIKDPYLKEWKQIQQTWIKKFHEELGKYPIFVVELMPYEIRGLQRIAELANKINI